MTQLFKQEYGNLVCLQVNDNEAELREHGFKTLEELFPADLPSAADLDAVAAEEKARKEMRKGRK